MIWFCEQFDDYVQQEPRPVPDMSKPSVASNDQVSFRGLCINCEYRAECQFATTPGGVWHCEEYL